MPMVSANRLGPALPPQRRRKGDPRGARDVCCHPAPAPPVAVSAFAVGTGSALSGSRHGRKSAPAGCRRAGTYRAHQQWTPISHEIVSGRDSPIRQSGFAVLAMANSAGSAGPALCETAGAPILHAGDIAARGGIRSGSRGGLPSPAPTPPDVRFAHPAVPQEEELAQAFRVSSRLMRPMAANAFAGKAACMWEAPLLNHAPRPLWPLATTRASSRPSARRRR